MDRVRTHEKLLRFVRLFRRARGREDGPRRVAAAPLVDAAWLDHYLLDRDWRWTQLAANGTERLAAR